MASLRLSAVVSAVIVAGIAVATAFVSLRADTSSRKDGLAQQ
jgi:hypothetical protein